MPAIHILTPKGRKTIYPEEEAREAWERGAIPVGSLYWMPDMTEWKPVTEHFGPVNPAGRAGSRTYTRDPKKLTSFVVVMLWICLGMEIIAWVSDIGMSVMISRPYTLAEAEAADMRQTIVGMINILVYIVTAVGFLRWTHRATLNSGGFGAKGREFTPGWSVGFYFIPIMSLFKPYSAMKENWQVSLDPRAWRKQAVPWFFPAWWGLWLLSNIMGNIQFRLAPETIPELKNAMMLSHVSHAVDIPLTLLAIKVISGIAANQERWVNGKAKAVEPVPAVV